MAEIRKIVADRVRGQVRRRTAMAQGIRTGRQELSRDRGHIYLEGEYAPPPTNRNHRGPLTRAEIIKIIELKAAGWTHLKVSEELDISMSTVARVCREHKIASANPAKGIKKEKTDDQLGAVPRRRAGLLAAHDTGLCDQRCRLGRHGYR